MKRMFWILLATAGLAAAQNNNQPQPTVGVQSVNLPMAISVIEVKNADPKRIEETLMVVLGSRAVIHADGRNLVIRADPEVVKVAEDAIKKLDVPRAPIPATSDPNVELTVQLVYGYSSDEGAQRGSPIPADLEPTIKQLRSVFPYKNYRLLDTMLLRGRNGQRTESSGILKLSANEQNTVTQMQYTPEVAPGSAAPHMVRLRGLNLGLRIPILTGPAGSNQFQYINTGINTELDAREGQRTVVGKSNIGMDDAIILVITPKVIE